MTNGKRDSIKTIFFTFLFCVVLYAVSIILILYQYNRQKNAYIERNLEVFTSRINTTVKNLDRFSRYVFDSSVNTPEVCNLLALAWRADKKERDDLRAKLYAKMSHIYSDLIRYNFRQLHFHLPDTSSFLRMHSPNEYGDILKDVRVSVLIANRDLQPVTGFEEGRIFNGYRFVYPLFHDGQHCGSVEVSFSMAAFIDVLSELSDCSFAFIIKRSVVESTVFPDQQSNYVKSDISENYLYDRNIKTDEILEKLAADNQDMFDTIFEAGNDTGIIIESKGAEYLVLFRHVRNLADKQIGWILSAIKDEQGSELRKQALLLIVAVSGFLMLLFFILNILRMERENLALLSMTDALTGIANRNSLKNYMAKELKKASRFAFPISCILFDIDHFKNINDKYGHDEGDRVLKKITETILSALRETDFFARWGGEEFVIILSHCGQEETRILAERARSTVEQAFIKYKYPLTISLGLSTYKTGETLEELIARADSAMYQAKNEGRNRVCVS
mgnify:CR=1 FL=1